MVGTDALRAIFRTNLGVKKSERVLVFTDKPSRKEELSEHELLVRERTRDVALLAVEAGRPFCREIVYHEHASTGLHGVEPPARLWEQAFGERAVQSLRKARILSSILNKKVRPEQLEQGRRIIERSCGIAVDAVVALSYYSTSHTTFRNFLTGICGARYASMPLFEPSMLEGSMDVDWRALARTTRSIARTVSRYETVHITTPNGTDLRLSKKGRKAHADTGILTRKGSFGNLPAGEVYLAPHEGTAEGKLVLEWAQTRELKSPVTVTVRKGLVSGISGQEPFALELEKNLSARAENRNIAELGIGTNPRARRPDNILESEKILGSIHIAFGDNSSFGGKVKTPFHQDYVFFHPTVALVGSRGNRALLMKDGKLNKRLLA